MFTAETLGLKMIPNLTWADSDGLEKHHQLDWLDVDIFWRSEILVDDCIGLLKEVQ